MSRLSRSCALAVLLVLGFVGSARADIEVTPFAGIVIPNQELLMDTSGGSLIRHQSHTVFGLTLSKPLSDRFDVELTGTVGTGKVEIVSGDALSLASTMVAGDLRARFRLAGGDDAQLGFLAGVGWTQFRNGLLDFAHEQDEDSQLEGKVTGLVGLGVRARIAERLRLVVDVQDRIHDTGLELTGLTGLQKTQHDLEVTAGFAFPLQ